MTLTRCKEKIQTEGERAREGAGLASTQATQYRRTFRTGRLIKEPHLHSCFRRTSRRRSRWVGNRRHTAAPLQAFKQFVTRRSPAGLPCFCKTVTRHAQRSGDDAFKAQRKRGESEDALLHTVRPLLPQGTQTPLPLGAERPLPTLLGTEQTSMPFSSMHGRSRRPPHSACHRKLF